VVSWQELSLKFSARFLAGAGVIEFELVDIGLKGVTETLRGVRRWARSSQSVSFPSFNGVEFREPIAIWLDCSHTDWAEVSSQDQSEISDNWWTCWLWGKSHPCMGQLVQKTPGLSCLRERGVELMCLISRTMSLYEVLPFLTGLWKQFGYIKSILLYLFCSNLKFTRSAAKEQ